MHVQWGELLCPQRAPAREARRWTPPRPQGAVNRAFIHPGRRERFAALVMRRRTDQLRATLTGGRNIRLYGAAKDAARLEATGALRWSDAEAAMLSAAAACGLEEGEARQTIANGRRAGEGEPWVF